MGRVRTFTLIPAGTVQGAGPTTGPWVKIPGDARVLFLKFAASAAVDVVIEQTADPNSSVRVSALKTFANGVGTTDTAKTDFLPYVRAKVTGASTIGVTCDYTFAPFAPSATIFDLVAKSRRDPTDFNSGWRKIPDDALSFYGVLDADQPSTGITLDVKLQTADDSSGTNAADVTSGAFTQVTDAAVAKEAKGPFTNFKQSYVRAVSDFTGAAVKAAATLNPAGANNSMSFTADVAGAEGNDITIAYTVGASLVVSVVGKAISVQLVAGVTTAAQVKTAIEALPAAAALVDVANAGGDSGAGTLPGAIAATPLTGGSAVTHGVRVVAR